MTEGHQILEDGSLFRDKDWKTPITDPSLPLAFGLKAPPGGYATEATRTYGLYAATLADLGKWSGKVAELTAMNRFKVLLDCDRARVYGYQEALKAYVPVLWVDRFGHWVGFHWQQSTWSGSDAFTVRVINAGGKGVQISWAAQGALSGVEDFLRTDFIGIPSPSLLVRGLAGRPERVQLGSPGSLPVPAYVPNLPASPETPATPIREWILGYSDSHPDEVVSLQDPKGLKSDFRFQSYAFPDSATALRGVSEVSSVDPATGATWTQTWTREIPNQAAEPWTVSSTSGYSDGQATEGRSTVHTFVDAGKGPGNPWLRSVQILGAAGNTWTTTYDAQPAAADGTVAPTKVHLTATGTPPRTTIRTFEASTGLLAGVSLAVNGMEVEARTFSYGAPFRDLGPNPPTLVAVQRQGLPRVQERFAYSAEGWMTRRALQAGGQERGSAYGFDVEGRLKSLGVVASWTADPGWAQTYTPSPLGPVASARSGTGLDQPLREAWEYGDTGQVNRHTDPKGNTTVTRYDLWGRPLTVCSTGSPTLTFTYPDERTRAWQRGRLHGWDRFDAFGRLQARLRGDGVTETFETDAQGRRVLVSEDNGQASRTAQRLSFDALDRVLTEQLASGPVRAYAYRASGVNQVVTVTAAEGATSSQTLDPWGQVVASENPSSSTWTSYNEFGQATQVVQREPGGKTQVRSFSYDGIGKRTGQTEPETQTTTFSEFNASGLPGRVTDASRRTIMRTYDALGRLLTVSGGSLTLANAYRGPFLVGRNSSDGMSQAFSYGAPGARMDAESLAIDGVKRTIAYAYDPSGNRRQMAYPGGRVVGYGHDSLNRIVQVSQNGAALATLDYDGWGNRTGLRFASGARSLWGLDSPGQHWQTWDLSHSGSSEHRTYRYDAADHLTMAGEWTLRHDGLGRLSQAVGFGLATAHGYDGFGNNISHTTSGALPAGFNGFDLEPQSDNRIPALQGNGALTGWVVAANGEASQFGTGVASHRYLSLGWDSLGRLQAVSDSGKEGLQRYRYAPSGLRVGLTDGSDARANRQFLYSDGGLLLGEYLGDGRWNRDVIYLGDQAIAEVDAAGVHELHPDHLGTPRVITNGSSGMIEGRQAFGPYGERIDTASHSEGYQPLTGYTGHLGTDATGLIYMRGRFYCPAWHRFLNSDQGVDPTSWNQFAYVGGSPFQATDPSGLVIIVRDANGAIISIDGKTPGATVEVVDSMPPPMPRFTDPWPGAFPFPSLPGTPFFPVAGPQLGPGNAPSTGNMPQFPRLPPGRGAVNIPPPPPPYEGPAPDPVTHPRVANPGTEGGELARAVGQEGAAAFEMLRARAAARAQAVQAEQEKHGIWWDFCHKLGLIQTDADRIQNARGFLAANTAMAYCDCKWVRPQDMSDDQALSWWREYTQQNKLIVAAGSRGFASMGGSRLTNGQAGDLANYLGFNKVSNPPFNSHGQAVFESRGRYITHDVDGHRGGVWKEFDRQGNRTGTLDALLNRIGD